MFAWFRKDRRSAAGRSNAVGCDPIALRPRDCHSHVLPGVDDGSRNMDESLDMLRLLVDAGARRIIATSHIYPGKFANEREILEPVFRQLVDAAEDANIDVELELGAEHYLDQTLETRIREGRYISFGPESYVLFETHTFDQMPTRLFHAVAAMREAGLTPLMAHVERYQYLRGEEGWEIVEDLRAAGVRFQVNRTVGKINVPGVGSRGRMLTKLQRAGYIDEVGSDLHRATPEGRPYAVQTAGSERPQPS